MTNMPTDLLPPPSSWKGRDKLRLLHERMLPVKGRLQMTGLLTLNGGAPISPLGYAVKMPAFIRMGLAHRHADSETDPGIVPYRLLRFDDERGVSYFGWPAAARFFDLHPMQAFFLFAPGSYTLWLGEARIGVDAAEIRERLSYYIESK